MTEVEKVRDVLVAHAVKRGIRSMQTHCTCGWTSIAQADGWYEHLDHQAERVVAARRQGVKK